MFHSQFGQDEFLDTHVFEGKRGGVFLEVGAHDGLEISNTLFFERERGWTGLCVEADPLPYEKLKVNRPAVRSYNFAAGENEGTMPFIQVHGTERMHSGPASTARLYDLDKHLKKMNGSRRTIDVPVKRLTICFAMPALMRSTTSAWTSKAASRQPYAA